jgi:outer membrane protein assembly factor BamE (lipoprotein component of BamABCDE complex)
MKRLNKIFAGIAITLLMGCAAGVNFKKMSEDQLTLGKTTKTEVLASMGKPNGKGTNTFNSVELEVVTYAYAKVGGSAALPGVTPARSQGLLFKAGILVGKEYTSSFEVDSTLFDTDKAKAISKGQTKNDVIAVMGLPLGEYLSPIIDDQNGHAFVHMFTQTKGFKSKSDLFVVEFNSANVVTKTKLSSSGRL